MKKLSSRILIWALLFLAINSCAFAYDAPNCRFRPTRSFAEDVYQPVKTPEDVKFETPKVITFLDKTLQLFNIIKRKKPKEDITEAPKVISPEEVDWDPYLDSMQKRIHRNWSPPADIAKDRTAVVKFRINRDGRLVKNHVVQTSGMMRNDVAAMQAVRCSEPFPPFPAGYDKDTIDTEMTFDYHVVKKPKVAKKKHARHRRHARHAHHHHYH